MSLGPRRPVEFCLICSCLFVSSCDLSPGPRAELSCPCFQTVPEGASTRQPWQGELWQEYSSNLVEIVHGWIGFTSIFSHDPCTWCCSCVDPMFSVLPGSSYPTGTTEAWQCKMCYSSWYLVTVYTHGVAGTCKMCYSTWKLIHIYTW